MKVLLVKNYAPDQQYSMLAFANMLERGLRTQGIDVATIAPPVRFGRNRNTTTGKGKWLGYIDKYLLAKNHFQQHARNFQPDIVHVCDHSNAMYLKWFSTRTLLTCNDLIAIRVWRGEIPGQVKRLLGAQQQKWIFNSIPKARAIACISAQTLDDLTRLLPQTAPRAKVIPMGLNYDYQPLDESEANRRIQAHGGIRTLSGKMLKAHWLLHIGHDGWYKNRIGAMKIWLAAKRHLDAPLCMVFVGDPPSSEMFKLLATELDQVAFLPNVSCELLQALYCKAECLIFPSLAEGYGWPPIEAQACGCPVMVSDIEPLRSNCQGAMLIDPVEINEAGQRLALLLHDSALLDAMSQKGIDNAQRFTADSMIGAYLDYYHEILKS